MKKSKNKEQFDYFTFPHEGDAVVFPGSVDAFSSHAPAERDYYGGFGEVVGVDEDTFLEEPFVAEEKQLLPEQKQKKKDKQEKQSAQDNQNKQAKQEKQTKKAKKDKKDKKKARKNERKEAIKKSAAKIEEARKGFMKKALPDSAESSESSDTFGRFRNLYTSRDGEFCLYEDADGHLIALDASKFA